MKTDLATTILTSIIGIVAAFFICKLLLPAIDDVTIKTINAQSAYTLAEPNPEIFNYRAVNPTVEVYVGQCDEYDENGECIDETEENPAQSEGSEGDQNGTSD